MTAAILCSIVVSGTRVVAIVVLVVVLVVAVVVSVVVCKRPIVKDMSVDLCICVGLNVWMDTCPQARITE